MKIFKKHEEAPLGQDNPDYNGALPSGRDLLIQSSKKFHFIIADGEGVALAFNEDVVKRRAEAARVRLARERALGDAALGN